MELRLDVRGVAEEIAEEVIAGVVFKGLKGEGEPGIGTLLEGLGGGVAFGLEVMEGLFEE